MVPAPGRDRVGSSRVYLLTNTTRGWMITPCYDKDQTTNDDLYRLPRDI